MTNNQSNEPENREQTFDEKLAAILQDLYNGGWVDAGEPSLNPMRSSLQPDSAKQAIKTLVLEDVVGEDLNSNLFDVDSPYYIVRANYQFTINSYKAELRQNISEV